MGSSSSSLIKSCGEHISGNKSCQCNSIYNDAHHVQLRGGFHWFVVIFFKCRSCGSKSMLTAEFDTKGKHLSWNDVRDPKSLIKSGNIDLPYEWIKQQYGEMENGGYDLLIFNCRHWSVEYFWRLICHPPPKREYAYVLAYVNDDYDNEMLYYTYEKLHAYYPCYARQIHAHQQPY